MTAWRQTVINADTNEVEKRRTTQTHTRTYQINGSIFLSQGIGTVKWRGIGGVKWGKGGAKYDPIGGGYNPTNVTISPWEGVVGHSINQIKMSLIPEE